MSIPTPQGPEDHSISADKFAVESDTTMAEYKTFGPGYNASGRAAAANVTIELSKKQYLPFSSPAKVFQLPSGEFGNTAWIDRHPQA